jgi:hypothetical protein
MITGTKKYSRRNKAARVSQKLEKEDYSFRVRCVERMPEQSTVAKVFKNIPESKWSVGKPRKSWLDDVENDLQKTGARGWRKMARDSNAWNRY